MTSDVEGIVNKCTSFAQNNHNYPNMQKIQAFPASWLLEFFAMDILGSTSKAPQYNQYLVMILHKYEKLSPETTMLKTTSTNIANIFFNHFVNRYRHSRATDPLASMYTDNGL